MSDIFVDKDELKKQASRGLFQNQAIFNKFIDSITHSNDLVPGIKQFTIGDFEDPYSVPYSVWNETQSTIVFGQVGYVKQLNHYSIWFELACLVNSLEKAEFHNWDEEEGWTEMLPSSMGALILKSEDFEPLQRYAGFPLHFTAFGLNHFDYDDENPQAFSDMIPLVVTNKGIHLVMDELPYKIEGVGGLGLQGLVVKGSLHLILIDNEEDDTVEEGEE